eukprot:1157114-Pelagomonas_calceolata.AAC.8
MSLIEKEHQGFFCISRQSVGSLRQIKEEKRGAEVTEPPRGRRGTKRKRRERVGARALSARRKGLQQRLVNVPVRLVQCHSGPGLSIYFTRDHLGQSARSGMDPIFVGCYQQTVTEMYCKHSYRRVEFIPDAFGVLPADCQKDSLNMVGNWCQTCSSLSNHILDHNGCVQNQNTSTKGGHCLQEAAQLYKPNGPTAPTQMHEQFKEAVELPS